MKIINRIKTMLLAIPGWFTSLPRRTVRGFITMHYRTAPQTAFMTARSWLAGNKLNGWVWNIAKGEQRVIAELNGYQCCPNCGWALHPVENPCSGLPFRSGKPPHPNLTILSPESTMPRPLHP